MDMPPEGKQKEVQAHEKHVQFADKLVTYIGKRDGTESTEKRCKRLFRKAFPFRSNKRKEECQIASEEPPIEEIPSPKPILKKRSVCGQPLKPSVCKDTSGEIDNSQHLKEMSSIYIDVDVLQKFFGPGTDENGNVSPSEIAITNKSGSTSPSSDMDKCSCEADLESPLSGTVDKGKKNDGCQAVESLLVNAGLVKLSPSSNQRRVSLPDFSQSKSCNLHFIPNLTLSLAKSQGDYEEDNGLCRSFRCSYLAGKPLSYPSKWWPTEESGTISLPETRQPPIFSRRHSLEPKEKYLHCHSFALASIKNLYSRILEAGKVSRDKRM